MKPPFDLGHATDAELQGDVSNGIISQSLYNTISGWVGHKGQDALNYAEKNNIQNTLLPTSDLQGLQYLSDARLDYNLTNVSYAFYNAAGKNGLESTMLINLPADAQTAIADVVEQYGPNLDVRAPNFWSDITHYDWSAAENELLHFNDAYTTRRENDAAELQKGIDQGGLIDGKP